MTNINHQSDMNDNDDNYINQSIDVTEVPYNAALQREGRIINNRIAFGGHRRHVRFGQAEPWSTGWVKTKMCLEIFALFLAILLSYLYLAPHASPLVTEDLQVSDMVMLAALNDNHQDIIMEEENSCSCENAIIYGNLNDNICDKIVAPVEYDEQKIAVMLKESPATEIVDNLTCTLYDIFLYVVNKLVCLKDNIIDVIPPEPPDGINSIYDGQDVADSAEGARSTNIHIPQETKPINSNEEFVEQNAV